VIMSDLLAAAAALLYICVFFVRNNSLKAALLSALDTVIIFVLISRGAPRQGVMVFSVAAAALNILVYFAPGQDAAVKFHVKDIFVGLLNLGLAAAAALFFARNGIIEARVNLTAGGNAVMFIFLAFCVAGYFIASGRGEAVK
jgi:hypothetical protein